LSLAAATPTSLNFIGSCAFVDQLPGVPADWACRVGAINEPAPTSQSAKRIHSIDRVETRVMVTS
jgi:hypothetical protein